MKVLHHGNVFLRSNGAVAFHPMGDGLEIATLKYADVERLAPQIKARYAAVGEDEIQQEAKKQYDRLMATKNALGDALVAAEFFMRWPHEETAEDVAQQTKLLAMMMGVITPKELAADVGIPQGIAQQLEQQVRDHIKAGTFTKYEAALPGLMGDELLRSFAPTQEWRRDFYKPLADALVKADEFSGVMAIASLIRMNVNAMKTDPVAAIHAAAEEFSREHIGGGKEKLAEFNEGRDKAFGRVAGAIRPALIDAMKKTNTVCVTCPSTHWDDYHDVESRMMLFAFKNVLGVPLPEGMNEAHGAANGHQPLVMIANLQDGLTLSEELSHVLDIHFPLSERGKKAADTVASAMGKALERWTGVSSQKLADMKYDFDGSNDIAGNALRNLLAANVVFGEAAYVLSTMLSTSFRKVQGYDQDQWRHELFAVACQHHFATEPLMFKSDKPVLNAAAMERVLRMFSPEAADAMKTLETEMLRSVEPPEQAPKKEPTTIPEKVTAKVEKDMGVVLDAFRAIEQLSPTVGVGLPGK